MIDELKKELKSTPREQLTKEWQELKEYSKVGPSAIEMIKKWEMRMEHFTLKNEERVKPDLISPKNQKEALEFSELFFLHKFELWKTSKEHLSV